MDEYTQAIEHLEKSKREFFNELFMSQPVLQRVLTSLGSKGATYSLQCRASKLLDDFKALCDHHFNMRRDDFMYCKCGERIRARLSPLTPSPTSGSKLGSEG